MEHTLVMGYVEALSGLLSGFRNNDMIVSSGDLEKLHNYFLEIVFKGLSSKKRDSSRGNFSVNVKLFLTISLILDFTAALTAALAHSDLLNKWFMGSYKKWFECLKFYALHKNLEDSKIGTKMFSKFMGEISHELSDAPSDFSDKAVIVEVRRFVRLYSCFHSHVFTSFS